mgnify:CR=1 FL=1
MSDCSSCSSSSASSSDSNDDFNNHDLLQIINILLLPQDTKEMMDIVKWKDSDIIDLIERLDVYFHNNCDQELDYSLIVDFINKNRKPLKKRRVKLSKFDDDKLRENIETGLKELN